MSKDECWKERLCPDTERKEDIRDPFQRDHARLVHSSAFRRLQTKTQVLGLGESDFYRTRLTHTMEVAQIGTAINKNLQVKYSGDREKECALPPRSLMNAICLAHDIGHPPFGHGGEVSLNKFMFENGKAEDYGFEGNGQTLRILSRLDKYSSDCGLNPTRRMLLGILKYPAPYSEVANKDLYPEIGGYPKWEFKANEWKPPKCFHDAEKEVVDWVLEPLSEEERGLFTSVEVRSGKHSKAKKKTLDTSIMELADDIAYGVHDLEDSISVGMINQEQWRSYMCGKEREIVSGLDPESDFELITSSLFSGQSSIRKRQIGTFVHSLISSAEIWCDEAKEIENPLIKYSAKFPQEQAYALEVLKEFVEHYVIRDRSVQLLEFKGQKMVTELSSLLLSDPERFLPASTFSRFSEEGEDPRVICDYIAGMTDEYAARTYQKMFVSGKGSIFDKD
mgnify:FL=1